MRLRRHKASDDWVPEEHGTAQGAMQRRVARGLTWTLIDTWGSQLLQLVIFAILARLLTEADIGLVALALVFVNFAQLFVDQGLGDALIQRPTVTRLQLNTAFWVAVVTGLLLMAVGIALAEPLAIFLDEPDLAPILIALSLGFVVTSLSSVQLALLRREMAFRALALRRLVAVAISGVLGVAVALAYQTPWALVVQQLSYGGVSVIMLWGVSPWRPRLEASRADFRELFSFGINVVGNDVFAYISRNADNLLIGAVLGPAALGLYAVGYRILGTTQSILVNAARKLAFPVFSRLQHNRERLIRAYLRVDRAISVVILPGYIGLALVAQEAVVVLFGAKWAASGPVATTLFLIGPVLTIQVASASLLNAVGYPNVTFRFRMVTTVVHVIGFIIAVTVFADIVAVAAAFVIGSYLLLPLNLYLIRRYAGVPISELLWQLRWVALATAIMAGCVLAVKFVLLGEVRNVVLLAVEVTVGVIAFVVAMLVLERNLFMEVLTVLLQALPGGERVGRWLHLPIKPKRRGKRRAQALEEAEVEMDIAADEPQAVDV